MNMRVKLIGLGVVVLVLVGVGCAFYARYDRINYDEVEISYGDGFPRYYDPLDEVSGKRRFVDSDFEIEFEYPVDWYRPSDNFSHGVSLYSEEGNSYGYTRGISFVFLDNPNDYSVTEFIIEDNRMGNEIITIDNIADEFVMDHIPDVQMYRLRVPHSGIGDVIYFAHKDKIVKAFVSSGGAHGGNVWDGNDVGIGDRDLFQEVLESLLVY